MSIKTLSNLIKRRDGGESDLNFPIESIVSEVREIEERTARNTIFRSRANWSLYGDKPSKYFLGLEKRRAKESTIATLVTPEGTEIKDHKAILQKGRRFYQELYGNREQTQTPLQDLDGDISTRNLTKLTP